MTNAEAIYLLKNTAWLAPSLEPVDEAVDMAIKALQVDLVRCGECKYQNKSENEREAWNLCDYRPWIYKPISDDYYCGDGERRSDETD